MGSVFNRGDFTRLVSANVTDAAVRTAIFDLLKFAEGQVKKQQGPVVVEGGQNNKSFHYIVETGNGQKLLFSCDCAGYVSLYLGNFTLKNHQVSRFLDSFGSSNPAFDGVMRYKDKNKRKRGGSRQFEIEKTLVDPHTMKKFQGAILKLQKQIENTSTVSLPWL